MSHPNLQGVVHSTASLSL